MSSRAIATLHAAFGDSFESLGQDVAHDRNVVVLTWPSVPVEIIRSAGFTPVLARGSALPTPAADQVVEAGIFPNRIRQLLEAALCGRLAHVAAIVVPRTSDADYKAFLYLLELRRRGQLAPTPPLLLFDLLQSEGADTAAYNAARAGELHKQLARLSGAAAGSDAIHDEIVRGNTARAAARCLLELRAGTVRVTGSELLPLLGARWLLPPDRYTLLAGTAREMLAQRAPLSAPRVLLAGMPVDSTSLHAQIEALHGTVVDEISPFGTDSAAGEIDATGDPFAALAAWYATRSITARTSSSLLLGRATQAVPHIDAAVMLAPPDDARFGWEVPRLRALFDARGIRHTVLRSDPEAALDAADQQQLAALLESTRDTQAARHG